MVNNEYCTFVISANGSVYQNFPINRWGNHAGSSKYPGVGEWVSSKLVGIELCCAGKLTQVQDRFVSWFGEEYERSQVNAVVTPRDNWKVGFYHKYTPEQEKSLISLLLWLKKNNPAIFKLDYVLGHDEVAPNRKTDPGGSLSMTMPELRDYLRGQA
jgi:N-acetyl-anhydromuramyl-L-alanine amidase AmpD